MTTSARLAVLVACVGAGATASAGGARPVSDAALLAAARQLVVVTTADWTAVRGTLSVFERSAGGEWTPPRGGPERAVPIVVGKNGTAWDPGVARPVNGPVKVEGDGKSPAGVFALGTAFGFAPASQVRDLALPYVEVTPTLECVDDVRSGAYNQLIDRAEGTRDVDWTSSEKMRELSPAYHRGVVIGYQHAPGRGRTRVVRVPPHRRRRRPRHRRLHCDGRARARGGDAVAGSEEGAGAGPAPEPGLRRAAHRVASAGAGRSPLTPAQRLTAPSRPSVSSM